jgi:hypothetical protein
VRFAPLALLSLFLAAGTFSGTYAQVVFEVRSGTVEVDINGQTFTTFHLAGSDVGKPFFAPLRTADGLTVTRGWPMEPAPGDSTDHPHQKGLWLSHGEVNGINFWENELANEKERAHRAKERATKAAAKGESVTPAPEVRVGKIAWDLKPPRVKGGKDSGTLEAGFYWIDDKKQPMLYEARKVTFYTDPTLRIMDIDVTLTAQKTPVTFEDTKEGTFAIRLAESMIEKNGGKMVNASGAEGEKAVWGKPSPWIGYSGKVQGKTVGVAILDHPSNPKHPPFWHCRAYGLCGANVFGEHDFFNDKQRNGEVKLEPGKSLRFRYRVVLHPGTTKDADVAKMFAEYAKAK